MSFTVVVTARPTEEKIEARQYALLGRDTNRKNAMASWAFFQME